MLERIFGKKKQTVPESTQTVEKITAAAPLKRIITITEVRAEFAEKKRKDKEELKAKAYKIINSLDSSVEEKREAVEDRRSDLMAELRLSGNKEHEFGKGTRDVDGERSEQIKQRILKYELDELDRIKQTLQ